MCDTTAQTGAGETQQHTTTQQIDRSIDLSIYPLEVFERLIPRQIYLFFIYYFLCFLFDSLLCDMETLVSSSGFSLTFFSPFESHKRVFCLNGYNWRTLDKPSGVVHSSARTLIEHQMGDSATLVTDGCLTVWPVCDAERWLNTPQYTHYLCDWWIVLVLAGNSVSMNIYVPLLFIPINSNNIGDKAPEALSTRAKAIEQRWAN